MSLVLLAQATAASTAASTISNPDPFNWKNPFVNVLAIGLGVAVGTFIAFGLRKLVQRRAYDGFPHNLLLGDAIIVVCITVVTSFFDLWKPATIKSLDVYSIAAYCTDGIFISIGCWMKSILSLAKDLNQRAFNNLRKEKAAEIEKLSSENEALAQNTLLQSSLEALVSEAMAEKLKRLCAAFHAEKTLTEALEPDQQLRVLVSTLHRQVAKHLDAGKRLRIGMYVLSDDEKYLEPTNSWDGMQTNVFSGKHADFMRLSAPGGAQSAVVQAWSQKDPFVFVPDCVQGERDGTFHFFTPAHRTSILSMVAYRHNMTGLSSSDAFVITLDSDQAGLFSADVERECRLLLPAFSRRIELELLASYLNPPQTTLAAPSSP